MVGLSLIACDRAPVNSINSQPKTLKISASQAEPYIENYAELVFQTYRDSHQQAVSLQRAITTLLENPSEATLNQARQAWTQARQSYLQTEAFRFYGGPIDFVDEQTGEEGPEARINAWPMNEAFIDYVQGKPDSGFINNPELTVDLDSILENDQINDEADVTTGWHAIEFLLWGQDLNAQGPGQRSFTDFLPDQGNNNRRRDYLTLVTDQLVTDLGNLEQAWSPDSGSYRATFIKADPQQTLSNIFTALATLSAFEMGSERLATSLDSGDQEDEHSCFSDTTHQDFIFNAQGIANVYRGDYGSYQGLGFDDLIQEINPEVHQDITAALAQTQEAIAQIPAPFDQMLASAPESPPRQRAETAVQALENQAQQFQKLSSVLGITVDILAE